MAGVFGDDFLQKHVYFLTSRSADLTGSLIGYLVKTGDLSRVNLRRAIVYGSVVASTMVQDFSLSVLKALTLKEVEARYAKVKTMSEF